MAVSKIIINKAVRKNGCRKCKDSFSWSPKEYPKPEHFCYCNVAAAYVDLGNEKNIITDGKIFGCPKPGQCLEPDILKTSINQFISKIKATRKTTSSYWSRCLYVVKALKMDGVDVPDFESIKPDPLNEDEIKALNEKVNKEIERANKVLERYKGLK